MDTKLQICQQEDEVYVIRIHSHYLPALFGALRHYSRFSVICNELYDKLINKYRNLK